MSEGSAEGRSEPAAVAAIRRAAAAHAAEPLDESESRYSAAVMIAVLPYEDPQFVLQVRSQEVEHHKGEVSFPGGAVDAGDESRWATALREAEEEMGIRPEHVELLGEQSHYRTITDFHVVPFAGLLDRAPYPFRPLAIEVAEVITPSLSHLLDPANQGEDVRERNGERYAGREYYYGGHRIFGATATMLGRLLDEVEPLLG